MEQKKFIKQICDENPNAVIVGSIGTISYDLKELNPPKKILVKGAMGHAMSIGLGYALGNPKEDVVVIIGDGSYLMCMGHISTILRHRTKNLSVYVLDNGCYKSCGGQTNNFHAVRDLNLVPFPIRQVV